MKAESLKVFTAGSWSNVTARYFNGATWQALTGGRRATPVDPWKGWPPVTDAVQAEIRPATVATLTLEVGPGKAFSTVVEAVAAVKAQRVGTPSPDNRADILISPGTYTGNITPAPYTSFIGITGNPADVQIIGVNDAVNVAPVGVLTTNSSHYIEGLSIVQPSSPAAYNSSSLHDPKYPIHHAHNGTFVLSNVVLKANALYSRGGGTCLGVDGGDAGLIFCHKTSFQSIAGAATNSHGANSNPTYPIVNIYLDCTLNNGTGYNALDASFGELYVMGNTTVQGAVTGKGTGVTVFVDPAATITGAVTADKVVSQNTYPHVKGAMSPYEKKRLYG